MKDEDFDLLIKRQIQKDTYIPEKINHLFANFENEVNMKKNQKNKIGYSLRKGVIAASSILVMFLGGCTYAHINGTETIISPLLRNLGINSKYEENATKFDEETTKQDIAVKMLDGAMDDTTFIVGYEIGIPDINLDKWIAMVGNYKINNVNITPINTSISKTEDGKFLYYQVFDMNELKIKDTKNVKIDVNIYKIKEYTEYMSDIITAVKGQAVTLSETENISFDIDELVKRVDILMKHELKNALIYMNVQMKAPKTTKIHGDINSLVQVINNMISNAIQAYNGKTEQNIDLILEKSNGNLIISVKDYGCGLPQKVQDKLFKEMITTKGKNGTGLGLYMSYSTIKAHFNGNITFETEEGKGTTFNIILPL